MNKVHQIRQIWVDDRVQFFMASSLSHTQEVAAQQEQTIQLPTTMVPDAVL